MFAATQVEAFVVSPNPAAGPVRMTYVVASAAEVELAVYDGIGRRVAVVASGTRGTGAHTEAVSLGALPAGVYLARLAVRPGAGAGTIFDTRRFTIIR